MAEKLKEKKNTSLRGSVLSLLGSFMYVPFGLMPKVMYMFFLLPGIFLNLIQQNLSMKSRYLPGLLLSSVALLIFKSPFVASLILIAMVLLGLFNLNHRNGFSLFKSGLLSIFPVSLLIIGTMFYLFKQGNFSAGDMYHYFAWELMSLELPANFHVDEQLSKFFLGNLSVFYPGAVVVFCSLIVFMALIFEKNLTKLLYNKEVLSKNLTYFKVPDYFVWITLVSGAVALIDHQFVYAKALAQNAMLICILVYYFQGFAILFNFFDVFKVSTFTKVLMTFCLALSLVYVTAVMGFMDYWYNFRGRFLKRATQVNERRGL